MIFQSTHPRGVRLSSPTLGSIGFYFNPRTHVGCDFPRPRVPPRRDISIHAPTWGATPSARAGSRRWRFQSTHPRGVRQVRRAFQGGVGGFQSTHPRGVRQGEKGDKGDKGISIHAPTWGATPAGSSPSGTKTISIHAPTWGATSFSLAKSAASQDFNPRTHVGCD